MARAIIRPLPLYIDGKKFAEVTSGTYRIASGDEAQIATEGYIGHSDGATTTQVTPKIIIPVRGVGITVDDMLLNKRYVTVGIPYNGKIHQIDMRIVNSEASWDFKTGAVTGDLQFEGGAPEVTG